MAITPDPHGKRVDVFVQLVQETDGLYDHVVGAMHVELDLGPGVRVTETELGLGYRESWKTFHQLVEIEPHTSHYLVNHTS